MRVGVGVQSTFFMLALNFSEVTLLRLFCGGSEIKVEVFVDCGPIWE